MSTRLKIDLSQGSLEVEGEEPFVQKVYEDFKERLATHRKDKSAPPGKVSIEKTPPPQEGFSRYQTLAECITAAGPKTDGEFALVAGAYLQNTEDVNEITGQQVNKALTYTGHGLGNITDALQANIDHEPHFVIQIAKSGKSKQARKKYKVTDAGFAEVQRMIGAGADEHQA